MIHELLPSSGTAEAISLDQHQHQTDKTVALLIVFCAQKLNARLLRFSDHRLVELEQ
jgi:hypothetical protein